MQWGHKSRYSLPFVHRHGWIAFNANFWLDTLAKMDLVVIEILFLMSLQKPFSYDVFINKDVVAKDFAECLVGIEEINELEMKVFCRWGKNC